MSILIWDEEESESESTREAAQPKTGADVRVPPHHFNLTRRYSNLNGHSTRWLISKEMLGAMHNLAVTEELEGLQMLVEDRGRRRRHVLRVGDDDLP